MGYVGAVLHFSFLTSQLSPAMTRIDDPVGFIGSAVVMHLPIPFIIAARPPTLVRLLVFASQFQLAIWGNSTFIIGDTFQTYALGCLFYAWPLFTALHFCFLTDALEDGTRHVHDKEAAKDMPLAKRVWWATCLVATFRGIGWSTQVPHVREVPKTQSRRSFIVERLCYAALYIFWADLVGLYVTHNPITSSRAAEKFPVTSEGLLFQAFNVTAWWGNVWSGFAALYELLAAGSVAFGLWEPRFWPPMFGSWWDAYTVRRTWGRVWHHILRRFIMSIGKATARFCGAQPGTNASSYIQLYMGFLVSGLLHAWGDRQLDRSFGRSPSFFMAQAVAITVEDGVVALGKRLGVRESPVTRTLGRVWTYAWFVVSTPLLLQVITGHGRPLDPTLPVSPVTAMWKAAGMEGRMSIPWPEPHA